MNRVRWHIETVMDQVPMCYCVAGSLEAAREFVAKVKEALAESDPLILQRVKFFYVCEAV